MGIIGIWTIYSQIFAAVGGLNGQAALQVHYFHYSQNQEFSVYLKSLLVMMVVSFGVLVVAVLVYDYYFGIVSLGLALEFFLLAIGQGCAQYLMNILLMIYANQQRAGRVAIIQIITGLLNGFCTIILVFFLLDNHWGRILGIMLPTTMFALWGLWQITRTYNLWRVQSGMDSVKKILAYALPLMPHTIGGLVIATIDRTLVANILGIEAAGYYTLALQIALILTLVADAFNRAFAPFVLKTMFLPDGKTRILKAIVTYGLLWLVLCLCLIFGAELIIAIIGGTVYVPMADNLRIMFFGMIFGGFYYLVTNLLFGLERTGYLSASTIMIGILTYFCTKYMIIWWGLTGGAMAFALAQILMFLGTAGLVGYFYFWQYRGAQ